MERADLLVVHASELLTLRGASGLRRRAAMRDLGVVKDGAVAIRGDRILAVGTTAQLRKSFRAEQELDARDRVVMPAFVDPHTHLVFGGWRDFELPLKLAGKSYAEILKAGGGIHRTVQETRAATETTLLEKARAAARSALAHGTTTLEAKSGYGLEWKTEAKQLTTARKLDREGPWRVRTTFLGAHAVPKGTDAEDYVQDVIEDQLPRVADRELADYADVFCEKGVFGLDQSRRILTEAKRLGLRTRMHADELTPLGGAELAAELGCRSADHLLHVTKKGVAALAKSETVAVMLPQVPLTLFSDRWAPARDLIDAGAAVALASDYNPNCPGINMQECIRLAVYRMRMSVEEAVTAATFNAAHALDLGNEVGSLEPGKRADLLVLDAPRKEFLAYELGRNLVQAVVAKGQVVLRDGALISGSRLPAR